MERHKYVEEGYVEIEVPVQIFDRETEGLDIDDPSNLENGVYFQDISYSAARIWNEFRREPGYSLREARRNFIKDIFFENYKRYLLFITNIKTEDEDISFSAFMDAEHLTTLSRLFIIVKEEVLREIIKYAIKEIPEKVYFQKYDKENKKYISNYVPNTYVGCELDKEVLKELLEEEELSSLDDSQLEELLIMFGLLTKDNQDDLTYLGCDDDAYECVKKACSDFKALRKLHNFLKALRYSADSVIGENYKNKFLSSLEEDFKNWATSKASWQTPKVTGFEVEDVSVPEKLGIDHKEKIYAPINRIEKYGNTTVRTIIGFVVVEHDILTPGSILGLTPKIEPKIFKNENEEILDLDYLHILDIQDYSDIEALSQNNCRLWEGGFDICKFPRMWE